MMKLVAFLSIVTASLSFTVADTKLFEPLRQWAKRTNKALGNLLCCGYCLGHWVALLLVVVYRPRLFMFSAWWPLDYFFTALVIAWLSGFQWALMCLLMQKAGK